MAVFTEGSPVIEDKLEINKLGTGTGEVQCEANKGGTFAPCQDEYSEGTELTLRGKAAAGSRFEGFSAGSGSAAACTGTANCSFTIEEDSSVTATFASESATLPLSVFISGEGKVSSSPSGINECTESSGKCTAEFTGTVTLTEEPATGYVFAGWIGCKHATVTTCEVDVTAASEVTAVFLKEGKEGKEGAEGTEGKEGALGEQGEHGAQGLQGVQGETGAVGLTGPIGQRGEPGNAGTSGAAGPAGPQGPAGPPGKVQLVKCKTIKKGKKKVQKCTTQLISGTVKFKATSASAHATLSRHGVVFASGMASTRHGHLELQLEQQRKLRPGRYMLTLVSGAGKHKRIQREQFTVS